MKKVLYALACLVVALIVYSMVGTPAVSEAAGLRAMGVVVRDDEVRWVQMNLPQTKARKVRIELLTPKVNGKRQLWQFCNMDYVGLGTYRCGLDVGGSTPARSMDGKWLGKLKVDGKRVGKVTFRSTR
ncbi:hypothetical protein BH20ACT23_BH20ACT23_11520 [soil metagenome]